MNKMEIKMGLIAALVAGAGMFANAAGKKVVATDNADFWLGPGCESCPWAIGEGVTAYIKELGLYLKGAGELADELADCAPWAPYVDELDGAYLPRAVKVPASVAATLPISVEGGSGEPSGAVSGAEPETVRIVDGKVLLGVSVCTNSEVKVIGEGEDGGWQKAAIEKAEVVDGEAILTVPATAEKGFMLLKSKGAAPTDNNAANKIIEDR